MSRAGSIERMRAGLEEALARADWPAARRFVERLKGIVLDAVAQDDSASIRLAGQALQLSGERLELTASLDMEDGPTAMAWELRADAGTSALAARIRPVRDEDEAPGVTNDVAELLLRHLRLSNTPLGNGDLARQTGKDPATITRTLKRLEQQRRIRRWRSNGRQLNALPLGGATSIEQMNALQLNIMKTPDDDAKAACSSFLTVTLGRDDLQNPTKEASMLRALDSV